jgi:hypothetical protein
MMKNKLALVAHTCNPCYFGGRDQKDQPFDQPETNLRKS